MTLTPQQSQIAEAIVAGLSYKMTADKLIISPEKEKEHIKKMYKKLSINSKANWLQ